MWQTYQLISPLVQAVVDNGCWQVNELYFQGNADLFAVAVHRQARAKIVIGKARAKNKYVFFQEALH